jgi:hypothetical protein
LIAERFTAAWRPRGIPAAATEPDDRADGGIEVSWELPEAPQLVGLALSRSAEIEPGRWGAAEPLHEGLLAPGCREHRDATDGLDRSGRYLYRLEARDRFGKLRLLGETIASAERIGAPQLRILDGTIAAGAVRIEWAAPTGSLQEFALYDASGRRLLDLRPRLRATSAWQIFTWDGRDTAGRRVPSGLYWVRLRAADESRVARLLMVR